MQKMYRLLSVLKLAVRAIRRAATSTVSLRGCIKPAPKFAPAKNAFIAWFPEAFTRQSHAGQKRKVDGL